MYNTIFFEEFLPKGRGHGQWAFEILPLPKLVYPALAPTPQFHTGGCGDKNAYFLLAAFDKKGVNFAKTLKAPGPSLMVVK